MILFFRPVRSRDAGSGPLSTSPRSGRRQSVAPRQTTVGAPFVDDCTAAMAFRINAQHGFAVFEQTGRRMPEVLSRLVIDDDLSIQVVIEVDRLWIIVVFLRNGPIGK